MNQIDAIDAFNAAIGQAGISTSYRIQGTGKVERFKIGKEDGKSGWAILFLDKIPAGSFGNWKTGEKHTWCAMDREQLPREEAIIVKRLLQQAEAKRVSEQARIQKQVAARAVKLLSEASIPTEHPYLIAKQIGAYTARTSDGSLLISVQDHAGITSIQFIAADGEKKFLPQGRVKGCYHLLGNPDGLTYITEGWATGCTIHKLTGRPVVVAFNAGNLLPVSISMRARYPNVRFLIAADNDQWGVNNAGLNAAKGTDLPYIYPTFQPTDVKPTDFNDLYILEGETVAISQLAPPAEMPVVQPIISEELPDQYVALPDTKGEKATPIATINNLREVLRRLDVVVRYNVISKQEEMLIPGEGFTMDNKANASLAWIESMCVKYGMPTDKVGSFLTYIADSNPYNPVLTWIESKPWDGKDRFTRFQSTITILGEDEDDSATEYKKMILRKWMLTAIAAACEPNGISAHGVLVLQGAQAMGKTSWFKRLCPDELRQDGVTLDLRDKDSQLQAISYWLVELGELDATFKKSDIAQLKSFLTRDRDVIRVAYAKRKSEYARRTVFFASVNEQEFLHDKTGNRRFWALQCENIVYNHSINMQQLWAELLYAYRAGESPTLNKQELGWVNAYNEKFEQIDPIEELIRTRYDWSEPESIWRRCTATTVAEELGFKVSDYSSVRRISAFVKKYNGNRISRTGSARLLLIPGRKV